jgi:hypothetical protein
MKRLLKPRYSEESGVLCFVGAKLKPNDTPKNKRKAPKKPAYSTQSDFLSAVTSKEEHEK